jgi:hypothetical protein
MPSIINASTLGAGGVITTADSSGQLQLQTAGTTAVTIDSSGRVTMSAQPRFLAERSGDQTGYNATSTGDVVVIYNSAPQNIGSHYNTYTEQVYSSTGCVIFNSTFLIYLNANDTVGYHPYNPSNTNQTINSSGNHTWFRGYLIS